jgi:hypothetical protein
MYGVHAPRAALGITSAGVVMYAWTASSTAVSIGEAMVRAGCRFAVHLDIGDEASGLTLLPDGVGKAGVPGAAAMQIAERDWGDANNGDVFYVFVFDFVGAAPPSIDPGPDSQLQRQRNPPLASAGP